jgi:hypothetical protein
MDVFILLPLSIGLAAVIIVAGLFLSARLARDKFLKYAASVLAGLGIASFAFGILQPFTTYVRDPGIGAVFWTAAGVAIFALSFFLMRGARHGK